MFVVVVCSCYFIFVVEVVNYVYVVVVEIVAEVVGLNFESKKIVKKI